MANVDGVLAMKQRGGLGEERIAGQIYQATNGENRATKALLKIAVLMATLEKSDRILPLHFFRAHMQCYGDQTNPFR